LEHISTFIKKIVACYSLKKQKQKIVACYSLKKQKHHAYTRLTISRLELDTSYSAENTYNSTKKHDRKQYPSVHHKR